MDYHYQWADYLTPSLHSQLERMNPWRTAVASRLHQSSEVMQSDTMFVVAPLYFLFINHTRTEVGVYESVWCEKANPLLQV